MVKPGWEQIEAQEVELLRMGSQKNPSTQEDKGIDFSTKESIKMKSMKIMFSYHTVNVLLVCSPE